jgi:hypothetical protein
MVGSTFGRMDLSYNQRRSLFSLIPFCTSNNFITNNNNKDSRKLRNCSDLLKNKNISASSSHFYLQQSSNSNSNPSSTNDGTQSTNSGSMRSSGGHPSHIITRHAPYQMSYHHRGNRSHRGGGHSRGEPLPKKTTGIPRDRLIPVPKHIPGALRDQTGASVVPRQMA